MLLAPLVGGPQFTKTPADEDKAVFCRCGRLLSSRFVRRVVGVAAANVSLFSGVLRVLTAVARSGLDVRRLRR
ncbi:MAG: hypothetical protein RMM53_10780 [Bacteroidia bacterium]|nr:hypothetical protein [Bacteroidia bacterium]MDW8334689.1 hypothetical protein [Bacteroidia bacterium]